MIAVPAIGKTEEEMLAQIEEANRKKADLIELRFDCLEKLDEKIIRRLVKACRAKAIATIRPRSEKGFFNGTEAKRIGLLIKAAHSGADFVDVEYGTDKKSISRIHKGKKTARILLSQHNFEETPPYEELKKLFDEMSGVKGVSVIKIVCYAKKYDDNKKCLELVKYAKGRGKRIVCFCMGPLGRDSRILSVILGAYFTFGSIHKGLESASGQMSIDEMRKIYNGFSVMF